MRKRALLRAISVCLCVTVFGPCHEALCQGSDGGQDTKAILEELRILKAAVDRMQNDIQQIKASLPARQNAEGPLAQTVSNVVLDVEGRTFLGQEKAKVTLIEFSDYQCPFCRNFATNTFPTIEREYIDQGKLKYYSFNFPLKGHPYAEIAARAVLCAKDQGKFWEMNDEIVSSVL